MAKERDYTIWDHAIERYIERILDIDVENPPDEMIKSARDEIVKAIEDPDIIYHEKDGMPQIHIRNNAGVVVGVGIDGADKILPYKSLDENIAVPTVYESSKFLGDDSEKDERVRA